MRHLVLFAGSSIPELGQKISEHLGCQIGGCTLSKFSNQETRVEIYQSVREKDVYIVQSGCGHVNDNLMELLVMIQACKTASAKRVTAVIPYFPYSRQADIPYRPSGAPLTQAPPLTEPSTPRTVPSTPRTVPSTPKMDRGALINAESFTREVERIAMAQKLERPMERPHTYTPADNAPLPCAYNDKNGSYREWVARSGTLVADLLTCAGADHIITMDLHDPQFQGFFDCPVDNLSSEPPMVRYIKQQIPDYQNAIIVSPDAGGAKRATRIAEKLNMTFALIHKERRRPDKPNHLDMMLVGDVSGKVCILVDDIADTAFTISKAAKVLHKQGAKKIYALITHAILSGDALQRIQQSYLDVVVVSNSVPQEEHTRKCSKLYTFNVAPIFAEAIRRTHNGESVSMLFNLDNELI
ncbi:phosphoribosyltransferase-like protein [Radiomyces spectabilis]|uniref:phosphoribosyltransferase-like protein n=1 Tax=Radiomyces spectabilis TaxID=64574 RepID=UPI00221F43D4|nr:phosphoribosyltransferase-like protein [Radiomyces spectabilis]KAI8371380.1 phosphoribosyltransferase-like protein [Radiomyces spectabilis]